MKESAEASQADGGTRRRDETLISAIRDATYAELEEHGYSGVTFEGVASRAKTSKPVLYRRYRSRAHMVTDALPTLRYPPARLADFAGNEILTARQMQDYRSIYLDLYIEFRKERDSEKESINDDVVFEIELIKQVEINVDYILMLVGKLREARGNGADKEMAALMDIHRSIDSSPTLRNKKDLVMEFVDRVSLSGTIDEDWRAYVDAERTAELEAIIANEGLKPDETKAFVDHSFRDGGIPTSGTAITKFLPPTSRFSAGRGHGEKKERVLGRLHDFFQRFSGLTSDGDQPWRPG